MLGVVDTKENLEKTLSKIDPIIKEGLITLEEYEAKRADILDSL